MRIALVRRVLTTLCATSLLMALCASVPAQSNRLRDAIELYRAGDMASAFPLLDDLALDGHPQALLLAGIMLEQGLGTAQDLDAATRYFAQAAGLGVVEAQRRLGQAYLDGRGAARDVREAREWLESAAAQGDVEAKVDLATIHRRGLGTPRDVARAMDLLRDAADAGSVRAQTQLAAAYRAARDGAPDAPDWQWLENAAREGDANAQAQLAHIYSSGAGGEAPDAERAMELYEQAALAGHADAQTALAYRFHTATDDPTQLDNAIAWYEEAAESGQPQAQNNLGLAYMLGKGVDRDPVRASEWFSRAASQGNAEAENNLALMLLDGDGIDADVPRALALLASAADKQLPQAETNLGYAYLDGSAVPRDDAAAARWFERAAERGYAPALGNLAYLHQVGRGVTKSYAAALALYHRSAGDGYIYAQRNLGETYRHGIGTRTNLAEAARWYRRAADQGDAHSAESLERICERLLVPGCRGEVVVLLRDEDGSLGSVLVQASDGSQQLLDDELAASRLAASGQALSVAAARRDIEAIFEAVLAEMPPEPLTVTLYFFDGQTRLVPASEPRLLTLIARVRREAAERDSVEIDVVGHTDRVGAEADNDRLSRARAETVRARLLESGVAPERVRALWRGERAPKVRTPDNVRESRNRRVEVFVR